MPSHLSTLGFSPADSPELQPELEAAAGQAERVPVPGGAYLHWRSPDGLALWFQVGRGDVLLGLTPYFSGGGQMNVGITQRLADDVDSPFDVSFHAWAEPSDADPLEGVYPFVFDAPDGLLHRHLSVPARVPLSLSAFAHELSVFASEEVFDASQTGELRYAAQSFIPSGLFSPDLAEKVTPSADAIFTGVVRETRAIRNPITGREIFWALTDTLGGSVDVVVDPALVTSPITAGGVISGSFWLSGRFPQAPVIRKGVLSRLVDRLRPSA